MNPFLDPAAALRAAKLASEQTEKSQRQMMDNWQNLMTAGSDSFAQLLQLSMQTATQLSRQQQQLLQLYANAGKAGESGANPGRASRSKKHAESQSWQLVDPAPISRIALVTGGIGGLGTAMCQHLAAQGHRVIATHIPQEADLAHQWQQERREEGLEIGIAECDVTDWDQCVDLAKRVKKEWGAVKLLVNNAGITRDSTLAKMEPDQWQAVLRTNLDSMFYVTKQFIEDMLQSGFGRIVNIASVNAHKGQYGQANYATAKRGVMGFTAALAEELANSGVTVNSISPGYVGTQMVEAIRDDIKQQIIAQIPLERLARPEEIANAVAFLLSDEAEYIIGADLSVNGGLYLNI